MLEISVKIKTIYSFGISFILQTFVLNENIIGALGFNLYKKKIMM